MNERLDSMVQNNKEYRLAEQKTDKTICVLEGILNQEQKKALDDYLSAENCRAAVYAEISYRQGMKDVLALLVSLIGE